MRHAIILPPRSFTTLRVCLYTFSCVVVIHRRTVLCRRSSRSVTTAHHIRCVVRVVARLPRYCAIVAFTLRVDRSFTVVAARAFCHTLRSRCVVRILNCVACRDRYTLLRCLRSAVMLLCLMMLRVDVLSMMSGWVEWVLMCSCCDVCCCSCRRRCDVCASIRDVAVRTMFCCDTSRYRVLVGCWVVRACLRCVRVSLR